MSMVYIGIDPGLTGALAVVEVVGGSSGAEVYDLPTVAAGKGVVKRELDPAGLARELFRVQIAAGHPDARVVLERTSAMPGQGVASMFSIGVTRGVILGVLGALGLPYQDVAPATWKRHFGLIGADKDMSRRLALQRFPQLAPQLARVKDHNRAEALLLALWLKETTK